MKDMDAVCAAREGVADDVELEMEDGQVDGIR